MPDRHDRWQSLLDGGDPVAPAAEPRFRAVELAQAPPAPIDVPRPAANETVTVTVEAGHPLKLGFGVDDVQSREVVRDDLVLGFDNGGTVVLKDYMQAFGQLGEHRTTIIQPDGKQYAFTELLAPTAGNRADRSPESGSDVVVIHKPAAGETEHVTLTADKPMALDFGLGDIAQSRVDKDGNLVLTFKDKGVLVLEGYAALKDHADIGVYFAKGDKIALGDLAPGAGPDVGGTEGGHLLTAFDAGNIGAGIDHLGPLGPLGFAPIPPPGPPGSPPGTPPEGPPPPKVPPPPESCVPPVCAPKVPLCAPPQHHVDHGGKPHGDHGKDHGALTWVKAAGCIVAGDVHQGGGGESGGRDRGHEHHAWASERAEARGWIDGHDDAPAPHHKFHETTPPSSWHDTAAAYHAPESQGHSAEQRDSLATKGWGQHDHAPDHGAALSPKDLFGHGSGEHAASVPKHAGDHAAPAVHFSAHDFAAVSAHAESAAPQIQNHAHHNVMGH